MEQWIFSKVIPASLLAVCKGFFMIDNKVLRVFNPKNSRILIIVLSQSSLSIPFRNWILENRILPCGRSNVMVTKLKLIIPPTKSIIHNMKLP